MASSDASGSSFSRHITSSAALPSASGQQKHAAAAVCLSERVSELFVQFVKAPRLFPKKRAARPEQTGKRTVLKQRGVRGERRERRDRRKVHYQHRRLLQEIKPQRCKKS
ncbi:uncharacterized protein V6R79_015856 [Siganus canaliculatus]